MQLKAKTGIKVPWLRRWEFDLCLPPQSEWDKLRGVLNLPQTPVLTITHNNHGKKPLKSLGEQLREHRAASRLLISQAARALGVSAISLGAWESNRAFPSVCYHPRIVAFLGYNPFPE